MKQITFIFVLAILAIMVITCTKQQSTVSETAVTQTAIQDAKEDVVWYELTIANINNLPDTQTIVNFTMADELILPPRIYLTQYIAGNITIKYNYLDMPSWGAQTDVRIWGWSRTGKIAFSKENIRPADVLSGTEMISARIEMLEYYILDLIKDEIVFECRWNSDNGMSYSSIPQQIFFDMSEKGIERMFNLQKETILSANMNHDIIYNQGTLLRFPFTHNNLAYNCRANTVYSEINMDLSGFSPYIVQTLTSYDIVLSRSDGRSKIIYSGSLGTGDMHHWQGMHICGYLRSPYENRIVVIVALERAGLGESLEYEFNGCHLDVGF
jgi:hypothetical protein